VVIVASLVTSAIGFSAVLGALIAGIVIAETEYRGEVEVITAPFRGLGLGIFLITVGISVDFRVVIADWQSLFGALVGVLVVKAAVTALLLRLGGARMAVAAETGVLMASPSETTLIVLGSATAAQLISRDTASFWQIVTAMGLTVTPLLAKLGRAAGSRFAGGAMARQMDASLDAAALGQVVILGFGRVGRMVADMLEAHGKDYLAVDSDVDGVAASRKEGYDVLFGDVARPELIDKLRERQPSALILTMDNPVLVNRLTKQLRRTFPTCRSLPAPATQPTQPRSTRPASPTRCPKPLRHRSNCPKPYWWTSACRWARSSPRSMRSAMSSAPRSRPRPELEERRGLDGAARETPPASLALDFDLTPELHDPVGRKLEEFHRAFGVAKHPREQLLAPDRHSRALGGSNEGLPSKEETCVHHLTRRPQPSSGLVPTKTLISSMKP
jgi:hypothetical protein